MEKKQTTNIYFKIRTLYHIVTFLKISFCGSGIHNGSKNRKGKDKNKLSERQTLQHVSYIPLLTILWYAPNKWCPWYYNIAINFLLWHHTLGQGRSGNNKPISPPTSSRLPGSEVGSWLAMYRLVTSHIPLQRQHRSGPLWVCEKL